jgi:hypothetical protein
MQHQLSAVRSTNRQVAGQQAAELSYYACPGTPVELTPVGPILADCLDMTSSVGQDLLENLSVYEIVNLTFPLVQADRGAELYELVSLEYTVDAKEPTTPFARQLARHSSRAKSVPRKSIFEGVRDALERWQFRQRYKITNRLQERARARQERKFSNSWYEAKLRAGLPADYLEDLRALTHLLEMQGVVDAEAGRPSPAVGRHVAITTMRASIASGAASLPVGILMMFIDAGMFTVDQALRQTASSADESMFVNLIRALATGLNGSLREQAITCASRLKTGSNKAIALAILARSGTAKNMEELLSQAVELASEIQDREVRARTLLAVAAQTSPELRINVEPSLAIVRSALTQEWQSHLYYDALIDIIHLGLADEALSIVGSINLPYERLSALTVLSGHMPDSILTEVLNQVWRSPNEAPVEQLLKTVVPRLDDSALHAGLAQAVLADAPPYKGVIIGTFAAEIARRGDGALALAEILKLPLPESGFADPKSYALEIAAPALCQTDVVGQIMMLIRELPFDQRTRVYRAISSSAPTSCLSDISDHQIVCSSRELAALLAPRMPARRAKVIDDFLNGLKDVREWPGTEELAAILPLLSGEQIAEVMTWVRLQLTQYQERWTEPAAGASMIPTAIVPRKPDFDSATELLRIVIRNVSPNVLRDLLVWELGHASLIEDVESADELIEGLCIELANRGRWQAVVQGIAAISEDFRRASTIEVLGARDDADLDGMASAAILLEEMNARSRAIEPLLLGYVKRGHWCSAFETAYHILNPFDRAIRICILLGQASLQPFGVLRDVYASKWRRSARSVVRTVVGLVCGLPFLILWGLVVLWGLLWAVGRFANWRSAGTKPFKHTTPPQVVNSLKAVGHESLSSGIEAGVNKNTNSGQPDLVALARTENVRHRQTALTAAARAQMDCPQELLVSRWFGAVELLASRGRDSLFRDLRSMIPILARVGGTPAVEESLIGVIAARRCWP